jgi:hypothetical protein
VPNIDGQHGPRDWRPPDQPARVVVPRPASRQRASARSSQRPVRPSWMLRNRVRTYLLVGQGWCVFVGWHVALARR